MQIEPGTIKQLNDATKQIESLLQSIPVQNIKKATSVCVKAEKTLSKLYVSRR